MYAIGVGMMMGAMVKVLVSHLFYVLIIFFSANLSGLIYVTLQLCYSVLGSMRIVVLNLDLCELMLKVNSD